MNSNPDHELSDAFEHDDPSIDVNTSLRLQEILQASIDFYRKHGGIPAEEVRKRIREWEAEERTAMDTGE